MCIRWVDNALPPAFVTVLRDVLIRLNVSVNKIRGQCYDEASAMSGSK